MRPKKFSVWGWVNVTLVSVFVHFQRSKIKMDKELDNEKSMKMKLICLMKLLKMIYLFYVFVNVIMQYNV